MNAALIALIGLAGVGIAVAASASPSSSAPAPAGESLVNDAAAMVKIFESYTTSRSRLTHNQEVELAKLNAQAKGINYLDLNQYLQQGGDTYSYRRTYFLPPGAFDKPALHVPRVEDRRKQMTAPDYFSGWSAELPTRVFVQWVFIDGVAFEEGYYIDWFGRNIGNYREEQVVRGRSDLLAILEGFYDDFSEIGPEAAKIVADIASNYPGIGTAIAGAVTFLSEVGSGASLEDATLAAGRAAVPSTLRAAYDVGVGLATQGELDAEAAAQVIMALAISQGVITGDVLERYETIKRAYEDAKAVGAGLEGLGTAVKVAV